MSQLFDDAPQDTTTGATEGGADKAATTTGGQEENTLLGGEEKPAEAKPDQGGEDPEVVLAEEGLPVDYVEDIIEAASEL